MLVIWLVKILYYGVFLGIGAIVSFLLRLGQVKKWGILFLAVVVAFLTLKVIESSSYGRISIEIHEPSDDSQIEGKVLAIKGVVSASNASVFVLIHPESTSMFWVQDLIKGDKTGAWEGKVYLGTDRMGTQDRYEIVALSSTSNTLFNVLSGRYYYPGQTMTKLPEIGKSNIIHVERMK